MISRSHNLNGRGARAQSTIEVLGGILVLVPIALFLFDLAVMVICQSANDTLAKNAARAAANQPTRAAAQAAADRVASDLNLSAFVPDRPDLTIDYRADDRVTVTSSMQAQLPVPLPGLDPRPRFTAQSMEPVVAATGN